MKYSYIIMLLFFCLSITVAQKNTAIHLKKIRYPNPTIAQQHLIQQLQQCPHADNLRCSEKTKGTVYKVNIPKFDTCRTLFLTFDACISGFDIKLINFLIKNKIKATLFVTAQWIVNQPQAVALLKQHLTLFDIQNHGTLHRPASLCGCKVYGIEGTHNDKELVAEIMVADSVIYQQFGIKSTFFRPGTAFSDQQALCGVETMGYKMMGYSVAADAGASFPANIIKQKILQAHHGDILLLHFNAKGSNVYDGFIVAYQEIVDKEYCIYFDKIINFYPYLITY